ncbi:hypothetical protein F4777DRAFT_570520 [Nemania sp. FL0916]|nr:hypothetical protein F4777DRAFT_570520 [Nemania sp. FL0916]
MTSPSALPVMPGSRGGSMNMQPSLQIEEDDGWTKISKKPEHDLDALPLAEINALSVSAETESIQDRIVRVAEDLSEIKRFYNIEGSPTRYARLSEFFDAELSALAAAPFTSGSQDDKADYLLLKNYLSRAQHRLELDRVREAEFAAFVEPFAEPIRKWCELRQRQRADEVFHPQTLAESIKAMTHAVRQCRAHVAAHGDEYSQATGSRAARRIGELHAHLKEFDSFYAGYHPEYEWWVGLTLIKLGFALDDLEEDVREKIVGDNDGDDGDENSDDDNGKPIFGEPIGRDGLLVELEAEMIPYTPEELLEIAEREYAWCEAEMQKASTELGFANWRDGLEHVKNLYEPPETHTTFVRGLVTEGAAYVRDNALVTVPRLSEEAIRVTRIPPEQQRVSPFFLGGPYLQIAYPRNDMLHGAKEMTLRGNNRHFSRATAFHEMVPGHRLQQFVGKRSRPYRGRLFTTPFYAEGWALYWEMLLWNRGDFFVSPEDRIGSMFWRMHRCVRITFSLGFHLGKLTAAECVELLVKRGGHERSTAEGEVRRSLNGSYPPLYQAGYMLGALQLMQLRREALQARGKKLIETEFHDSILKANVMPIEMLRALLLGKDLKEDFKPTWRFYGDL